MVVEVRNGKRKPVREGCRMVKIYMQQESSSSVVQS
jgi:hypothetical protein